MDKRILKLRKLCNQKMKNPLKRLKHLDRQLKIISDLLEKNRLESLYVKDVLKKVHLMERKKEFSITRQKYNEILKHKEIEMHLEQLFNERISEIRRILKSLEVLLLEQKDKDPDYQGELELYGLLERELCDVDKSKEVMEEYFKEISKLTYEKRWVKGGLIISKIMKGVKFRVDCDGIENIPKRGPCILAPHHCHGGNDVILNAIVSRSIYYLTCVETFIAFGLARPLLYKLGCLPFKRDDDQYQERLETSHTLSMVENYPSSNIDSLKKMLVHLKHGDAVVIFPEGEGKINPTYVRKNDEDFLPPQDGFITLAFLAERKYGIKVPIVPIGFKYLDDKYRDVRVRIGKEVILPDDMQNLSKAEVKKRIEYYSNEIFGEIVRLSS